MFRWSRLFVHAVVLVVLVGLIACSAPKETVPKISGLRKVEMVPPDEATIALTAEKAGALIDSTWEVGGFVLTFGEAPRVHVAGEAIPIPGGVEGHYLIDEEGVIEVRALGQAKAGKWDGERLIVDGTEAARRMS